MAERKIGEIFEHESEWYQCVKDKLQESCVNCCFYNGGYKKCDDETVGNCLANSRSDGYSVCFKKLEKVGEPYMLEDKKFQKYKVFKTPYIYHKIDCSWQSFSDPYYVSLEIKEDMEEKKLNLKPFDIQKAREGKQVCTRDGRKARIICFDMNSFNNHIIVALITEENGTESIYSYTSEGKWKETKTENDLMILPEKKEGYANIYRSQIYDTLERAKEAYKRTCNDDNYLQTIKIEWEE